MANETTHSTLAALIHRLHAAEAQRQLAVAPHDANIASLKQQINALVGISTPIAPGAAPAHGFGSIGNPGDVAGRVMALLEQDPPPSNSEICLAVWQDDSPAARHRLSTLLYDMHHRRKMVHKERGRWVVNPSFRKTSGGDTGE